MPQMAPLNWLLLFSIFVFILMLISISIYSSFLTPTLISKKSYKLIYSWKW